jgi:hypothetical protein
MRLPHYANKFIDAIAYLTPSLAKTLAEKIFSGCCERVAHTTRLTRGFEGLVKLLARTSRHQWVRDDITALVHVTVRLIGLHQQPITHTAHSPSWTITLTTIPSLNPLLYLKKYHNS